MDLFGYVFAGIIFVALIGVYFLYLTRPGKIKNGKNSFSRVDPTLANNKWVEIQSMMKNGGPANYRQVIMEADKLVDNVLRSKVKGETMGERLKNARHLFSHNTYENLWTAHKIRNKIAHEADFEGLSSDANLAVRNFEKALKELKII